MKALKVYFQTVTPESAAEGDYDSMGEHNTHDVMPDKYDTAIGLTSPQIAAALISETYGYIEPSSSKFHKSIWYSTIDAEQDYKTGEETNYTIHAEGFTEAEERELYQILTNRK